MFSFEVLGKLHKARRTRLTTPHGAIEGPFFQFVATQAVIRGAVFSEDLEAMNVQVVLSNTYHLHLRPGEDVVAESGGLHGFMKWNGPITTDSGGYQVFSLGKNVKVTEDGVAFRAPLDGKLYEISPEKAMDIQAKLGADIIMPLDVCTPFTATEDEVRSAVERTTRWAKRCIAVVGPNQALYGIVQGGVYPHLREQSARELGELDFFGYSIGGELQVRGDKRIEEMTRVTADFLPEDKPRYLMGYGKPDDILGAVRAGVDQFDCVLPIRNARHGQLFYDLNIEELRACLHDPERPIVAEKLYKTVDILKSTFARDYSLFSEGHPVIKKEYTKSYVHHLMRAEIPAGSRLCVLHNVWFYVQLMSAIREVVAEGMQKVR